MLSEIFSDISHMSKVCRNVETEPLLQPLDNEVFNLQSTVTSREARLDMKAGGFWTPRVNRKKRKYNQRVMDVEMGTFTPLVFGTNGGDETRLSELFKNSRK